MKRTVGAVALGLALAGCGGSPPVVTVADRAPALAERLDLIDAALVAERYTDARRALRALIADTQRSERTGEIDPGTAAEIIAIARRLLALLPGPADRGTEETAVPVTDTDPVPSRKPSAPATTADPTAAPTEAEPTASLVPEEPAAPSPSAEPTGEPSREATPTEQVSPAAAAP